MTVWFISDTHFGHQAVNDFVHSDGTQLRPFDNYYEADLYMVELWNEIVKPHDKVYHLGDVAFSRLGHELCRLLHGKKRLIRGNHDLKPTRYYLEIGFEQIYGVRQMDGLWLTHVPMHAQCVNETRVKLNIHGHMHRNNVRPDDEVDIIDGVKEHPKYCNVSVEQINFRPISLDQIIARKGL